MTNTPIQPSKTGTSAVSTAVAVAIAAAVAVVSPYISKDESGGKVYLRAYPDPATGGAPWTICDGDTWGVTRHTVETPEGCKRRLEMRATYFAGIVLGCTPNLRGHRNQTSAAIRLAYNIGEAAYCRSTVDRRFDAKQWRAACDAFLMWNKAGRPPRVMRGLVNRRNDERKQCLTELPT